jgi:hypothetical protein
MIRKGKGISAAAGNTGSSSFAFMRANYLAGVSGLLFLKINSAEYKKRVC